MRTVKGQATVFAIIGIVIVALVILLFFLLRSSREHVTEIKKAVSFEQVVATARNYIKECSRETLKESIKKVASQGGYYLIPEDRKAETPFGTTVYTFNKKNMLISKENMKQEILRYLQSNLKRACRLQEFNNARLDARDFSGNIILSASKITLLLAWPIDVSRGTEKSTMKEFTIELESRLDLIHTNVNILMEELDSSEGTHRTNLKLPEGFDLYIIQQENEALYIITDKLSPVDQKPLRFFLKVRQ